MAELSLVSNPDGSDAPTTILGGIESFFVQSPGIPSWKMALLRRIAAELDYVGEDSLSAPLVARFADLMGELQAAAAVPADPFGIASHG